MLWSVFKIFIENHEKSWDQQAVVRLRAEIVCHTTKLWELRGLRSSEHLMTMQFVLKYVQWAIFETDDVVFFRFRDVTKQNGRASVALN